MIQKIYGLSVTAIIVGLAYAVSYLPFIPFSIRHESQVIHPLEPIVIALILGVVFGNSIFRNCQQAHTAPINLFGVINAPFLWKKLKPGVDFSAKSLLPLGIVLMGVKFNLLNVLKISAQALIINLICVFVAYFLTAWICHKLKIESKLTSLIAIGTAICGGSAIIVAAPIIKANQTQTAIAMTVVSLYGLIAIFIFPLLGKLFFLNQIDFGIWAGTSIQAVPQVVAAGFAFGMIAGQTASIVKMVRILLLAPMVMLLGAKHNKIKKEGHRIKQNWHQYFPLFILYFLAIVALNTLDFFEWLDNYLAFSISHALLLLSEFFMAMAMVGIGLNTDMLTLCKSGGKPLLAGGIAMILIAGLSLLLIRLF